MSFILISFKNSLIYRSSILFNILGSIIRVLISIALWSFLYVDNIEMINYMIIYTIMSNIISLFYSGGMSDAIGSKVISGSFAIDLIRPTNFIKMNYFQLIGKMLSSFVLKGLPTIFLFLPLLILNSHFNRPIYIILAFIAIMCGHCLCMIIYSCIGFLAFVLLEIWPINMFMEDTIKFFSGALIPIALFPGWLSAIVEVMPFRFLYSFPLQLMINNLSSSYIFASFIVLFVWIILLGLLLLFSYKKAINKCIVQGG